MTRKRAFPVQCRLLDVHLQLKLAAPLQRTSGDIVAAYSNSTEAPGPSESFNMSDVKLAMARVRSFQGHKAQAARNTTPRSDLVSAPDSDGPAKMGQLKWLSSREAYPAADTADQDADFAI